MSTTFGNPCESPWYCRGEYDCRFGHGCDGGQCEDSISLANCISAKEAALGCDSSATCDAMSDADAYACYVAKMECEAHGCNRTLSTCYIDPTRNYMAQLYASYADCSYCTSNAETNISLCLAPCDSTFDTAVAACESDYITCVDGGTPIGECDAQYELCLTAANDAYATCTGNCQNAYFSAISLCTRKTNPSSFLSSINSCRVTESRRDYPDLGIDARPKGTCQGAELDCDNPCNTAYQTQLIQAYQYFQIAESACVYTSPTYADCVASAEYVRDLQYLIALTAFKKCSNDCCVKWNTTALDGDTSYQIKYLNCYTDFDLCHFTCGGDASCEADCASIKTTCLNGLGDNSSCINCGKMILDGYTPDPIHATYDLSSFIARFSC